MATLHKFKLLAMHCGSAQSPKRSSRRAPLIQFRCRKTSLRMLLRRSQRRRGPALQRDSLLESSEKKGGDLVRRHSLKELFGTSPPGKDDIKQNEIQEVHDSVANAGVGGSVYGSGSPRPVWRTGFRCRSLLSTRVWRPVLLTIHE